MSPSEPTSPTWLTAYPLAKFPIIPANLQHQRARIAEKFGLSHDIMRHTFISMHVAKYRSMGEAALQAGNSESIIRKHYLDLPRRDRVILRHLADRVSCHPSTPTNSMESTTPSAYRILADTHHCPPQVFT